MARVGWSSDSILLETQDGQRNVTLRDLFAAFALAGIVSSMLRHVDADKYDPKPWGMTAYELADAMLAAREAP